MSDDPSIPELEARRNLNRHVRRALSALIWAKMDAAKARAVELNRLDQARVLLQKIRDQLLSPEELNSPGEEAEQLRRMVQDYSSPLHFLFDAHPEELRRWVDFRERAYPTVESAGPQDRTGRWERLHEAWMSLREEMIGPEE